MAPSGEGDAVSGRAADGGSTTDHHDPNGIRDLFGATANDVVEAIRQQALVDHFQAAVPPAQRLNLQGRIRGACHAYSGKFLTGANARMPAIRCAVSAGL